VDRDLLSMLGALVIAILITLGAYLISMYSLPLASGKRGVQAGDGQPGTEPSDYVVLWAP
jgi:hypothetical protein